MILPHLVGLSEGPDTSDAQDAPPPAGPGAEPGAGAPLDDRVAAALDRASRCMPQDEIKTALEQWQQRYQGQPEEQAVAALEQWATAQCPNGATPNGKSRKLFWIGGALLLAGAIGGLLYWRKGDEQP